MNKFMLVIGGFVLALIAIGFALPRESRFVVETDIDAADATVYLQIVDPMRARLWLLDTGDEAQFSFDGPDRGIGASMTWNSAVAGSGIYSVTDAQPHSEAVVRLNAGEAGEAKLAFLLHEQQAVTKLRMEFVHDYRLNIVGRYFGLLATGVLRREYQRSVARLADIAEGLPQSDFSDLDINHVLVDAMPFIYTSVTSLPDTSSVATMLGDAFADVLRFIDEQALTPAGPPLAIAHGFTGAERRFDVGVPVTGIGDEASTEDARIREGLTYDGLAVMARHFGSWERIAETHRKITAYLAAAGIERNGAAWESYPVDPGSVSEEELVTEIYYPIRAR